MKELTCQHSAEDGFGRVCEHLIKSIDERKLVSREHYRFFTGQGAEFVLLCSACAIKEDKAASNWRSMCLDCIETIACEKRLGELGSVQVVTEDAGLHLVFQTVSLPFSPADIVAAHPLDASTAGTWLLLKNAGELMTLSFADSAWHVEFVASMPKFDKDEPIGLSVSSNGRFAGIFKIYGSTGWIINLSTRKITLELNRGTYYPDECRFPLAFFEINGRHLLVHATDWNRLDISDPEDGRLLTDRSPSSFRRGEPRPDHYLDYFHCGLFTSPDNEWMLDNGWVWQPVGVIRTWNLKTWFQGNAWESENGSTVKNLCMRAYYWDGPVCWIDNRTVAVWGCGNDDLVLVPGIRLFDVATGVEKKSAVRPARSFSRTAFKVKDENVQKSLPGTLIFDRWLFSWTPDGDFDVWSIERGTRLLYESDFRPLGYHRGSKEFLSISPDGQLRISRIQESK